MPEWVSTTGEQDRRHGGGHGRGMGVGKGGGGVMSTRADADAGAAGDAGAEGEGDRGPWTRNDALVAVAAAATDLVGFSLSTLSEGGTLSVTAAVLLVVSAMALLARRVRPVPVLAAILAIGVLVNVVAPQSPHFTLSLTIALYTVARMHRPGVVLAAAAAAAALASAGQSGWPLSFGWWGLAGTATAALITVTAAWAVEHRQREAEARRLLLADRAVAEERRRIARELHDIVAHHITTMQLMAGGARANLAYDPQASREALVTLEESGRMALREMRQLLDVLRAGEEPEHTPPAPQPGAGDLARIITESRLAGMETEFTVDGPVRPLPPSVGLTVFRIVQEALTNTRKHAGRARAHVRLTYDRDEVGVEVRDDGAGAQAPPARPAARPGYGLIGMHERVALQGGTLEATTVDGGGFRVAARIPAPAPVPAPVSLTPSGEERHG
ncbi:sensor histidine kinase [Streptomyces sp. NPDC090036]|uniref:sensor histidine kinase n=1 Tax=Streptomyces sp. NPDC090036 TaxID=3365926 RepID=UPI0037F923DE